MQGVLTVGFIFTVVILLALSADIKMTLRRSVEFWLAYKSMRIDRAWNYCGVRLRLEVGQSLREKMRYSILVGHFSRSIGHLQYIRKVLTTCEHVEFAEINREIHHVDIIR